VSMVATEPPVSPTTLRARRIVAAHRELALDLGLRAAELATDPARAAQTLASGLVDLADPEYRSGQARVAPGIGVTLGIRQPLLSAVTRGLRRGMRRDSSATRLDLAEHLVRAEPLELHWIAFGLLDSAIAAAPERSWQLVRREAQAAGDWITVDSLAHVAGRGILAEPYRWAELEQLVYSPSPWERRLVGSTIATIPFVDRSAGRTQDVAVRGLALIEDLIGDDRPEVQKALSWALRSLTLVDRDATTELLRREAATARRGDDGYRAWVVRDALGRLPAHDAAELRATVDGIRRRPRSASTSRAARTAAAFLDLGLDVPPADRPVIDRT
jgi:3-methyladenine DNA glycosylase AlkD